MPLHLVLPGLLWPAKVLYDCAHDLELPALGRLLGRGRLTWREPLALEDWLCREFGMADTPAAALRLLGEGLDPGDDCWVCADPGHLAIEQGRMTLARRSVDIADEELQILLDAVRPAVERLPGFVQLRAGPPGSGHAYLHLAAAPDIVTTPPSAALAQGAEASLPRGPQAQPWIAAGSEVQMRLHALPANRKREAQGRPVVNNLWFWGAGSLPAARPSAYRTVLGDEALTRGLARWSGAASGALPPGAKDLALAPRTLILITELAEPSRTLDLGLWRQRLLDLERDWFAPLAAAHGRRGELRLTALGPEATLDVRLRPADRLRFWKGPRPLASLTR